MPELTKADALEVVRRLLRDTEFSIGDYVRDYVDEKLFADLHNYTLDELAAVDEPLVAEVEGILGELKNKVKNWEV